MLLGADSYEEETSATAIPLGIGRDVVLDRVIVDKNARIGDGVRLVNAAGSTTPTATATTSATASSSCRRARTSRPALVVQRGCSRAQPACTVLNAKSQHEAAKPRCALHSALGRFALYVLPAVTQDAAVRPALRHRKCPRVPRAHTSKPPRQPCRLTLRVATLEGAADSPRRHPSRGRMSGLPSPGGLSMIDWLPVFLSGVLYALAARAAGRRSLTAPVPYAALLDGPLRRVRAADRHVKSLIEQGIRRSVTFRDLVAAVNASDVIVYIQRVDRLPPTVAGQLMIVPVPNAQRYLRIQVLDRLSPRRDDRGDRPRAAPRAGSRGSAGRAGSGRARRSCTGGLANRAGGSTRSTRARRRTPAGASSVSWSVDRSARASAQLSLRSIRGREEPAQRDRRPWAAAPRSRCGRCRPS